MYLLEPGIILGSCWVTTLPGTQPFPYRSWQTSSPCHCWKPRGLGDFNIHAEAEVTGLALEFLETMASLDMSQHVDSLTHVGGHTLDLFFSTEQRESGPMVTDL